jgi:hypothetical protein
VHGGFLESGVNALERTDSENAKLSKTFQNFPKKFSWKPRQQRGQRKALADKQNFFADVAVWLARLLIRPQKVLYKVH